MQIECSICCDPFSGSTSEDVRATICGHIFHDVCLNDWLARSRTCPQCRKKLEGNNGVRLYFSMNSQNSDVAKLKAEEVVRLSGDDVERTIKLKSTIKTAIESMDKLYKEIEHISAAKTMAKDSMKLSSDILKKLVRGSIAGGAGDNATQVHLKNTGQKISTALEHIAVFEDKMFVANRSLIKLAKSMNI